MKKLAVAVCVFALTTLSSPLLAQEGGGERGARQPSPVKQEMEKVDEALEAVEKFLEKPEGEAPLAEVAAAQAAMHEAKRHEPRLTQQKPEGERAAFVKDYRIQMNKTLRALLDLEDAMLEQDWKAAAKVMKALEEQKKGGHDKFKGKRRRGGQGGGEGGGEGRGER